MTVTRSQSAAPVMEKEEEEEEEDDEEEEGEKSDTATQQTHIRHHKKKKQHQQQQQGPAVFWSPLPALLGRSAPLYFFSSNLVSRKTHPLLQLHRFGARGCQVAAQCVELLGKLHRALQLRVPCAEQQSAFVGDEAACPRRIDRPAHRALQRRS